MADIELTLDGSIATLLLNRPAKRNALTIDMWRCIPSLVGDAQRSSARAIVVRGAGGHFAAGADISEFADLYASEAAAIENQAIMQRAMTALEECALPVLAVIDGVCVGGGCGLALACDMRWATPRAKFAITPARLGLIYGIADTSRLVRAVGASRAKDLLFTGRLIDAETALSWGLADRIESPEALDGAITTFAHMLQTAARSSISVTKRIAQRVAQGAHQDDDESRSLFAEAFRGEDFAEGLKAFLEKRPPKFS